VSPKCTSSLRKEGMPVSGYISPKSGLRCPSRQRIAGSRVARMRWQWTSCPDWSCSSTEPVSVPAAAILLEELAVTTALADPKSRLSYSIAMPLKGRPAVGLGVVSCLRPWTAKAARSNRMKLVLEGRKYRRHSLGQTSDRLTSSGPRRFHHPSSRTQPSP
jgi:hypothetical protein